MITWLLWPTPASATVYFLFLEHEAASEMTDDLRKCCLPYYQEPAAHRVISGDPQNTAATSSHIRG